MSVGVGDNQVFVVAHEDGGVDLDPERRCTYEKAIEERSIGGGIRAKQMVTANGAAGNEVRCSRQDHSGLGHESVKRTSRAGLALCDFNNLGLS